MPFTVSNFSVKSMLPLNTGLKHRHYFPKIGDRKSHCLITNELKKKDSDYDRFLPISERNNSSPEI